MQQIDACILYRDEHDKKLQARKSEDKSGHVKKNESNNLIEHDAQVILRAAFRYKSPSGYYFDFGNFH